MNYLKSQTNGTQVLVGFAIAAMGGVLTLISPLFFLFLVPMGAYSMFLGFRNRIKSAPLRFGVVVSGALLLALTFGGVTSAAFNPDDAEKGSSPSQTSESETSEPLASDNSPSPNPSSSASASASTSPTTSTAQPKASVAPTAPAAPAAPAQPTSNCQPGQLDLNTAPEEQLMTIIHIGPERVSELIRLRPYSSIEGLDAISGIGDARMADIRAQGLACVN